MTEAAPGRTAIVTGASSGNGRGIALALAEAGLAVVCADLRAEPRAGGFDAEGETATDELIRRRGGRSAFVRADVASAAEMQALVAETVAAFGRLDVLVNNAGIMPRDPALIVDDPEEAYDRLMAVNAKSVWLGAKYAIAQMMDQPLQARTRGKIVNVTSMSGALIGLPGFTPYAASKGAIAGMTMALAAEWAAEKITVNAIAPGFFPTAMTSHIYAEAAVVDALTAVVPMHELGRPEDLGGVVAFLASPAADYLTGQVIPVDGGYTRIGAQPSGRELAGRTALVTGGGRGIGAGIARELAAAGAAVAIVDLDGVAAQRTARELRTGEARTLALEADLTDPGAPERVVGEVTAAWERLDILVNNAGVLAIAPLGELRREQWERVMAVNVTVPMLLAQQAAPHLARRGGAIVNVTSIAADFGAPGSLVYSASKGALQSLTRALAVELAPEGIRVNAVAPHGITTDMTAAMHDDDTIGPQALAGIPLGRFGEPVDVARAVRFLAGDGAAFITGATIPVQGGAAITLF